MTRSRAVELLREVAAMAGFRSLAARRALLGAVLAQGAPLGWLSVRWLWFGVAPGAELRGWLDLYVYLTLTTTSAFSIFGYALGRLEMGLADANRRLAHLAHTDALTHTENRRGLADHLPRLASYARRAGLPLAIVAIDVDGLKRINDRYGHIEGDALLARFALLLGRGRRTEDVVARTGGDEFVLVLPGVDCAGADRAASRILEDVRRLRLEVGREATAHVTASAGIAQLERGDDDRSLLVRADAALYEAKRRGGDRVASVRAAGGGAVRGEP